MSKNYRISEEELTKLTNRLSDENCLNVMDNENRDYDPEKVNIVEISFYEDMEDTEDYFQDRYEEYAEIENEAGGYNPGDEDYIDPDKSVWEFIDREAALNAYIDNARTASEMEEMERIFENTPYPSKD